MNYILDTNAFRPLFQYFDVDLFPSIWAKFDEDIESGCISSVHEVYKEIINQDSNSKLARWSRLHLKVFTYPSTEEQKFIKELLASKEYKEAIPVKKIITGDNPNFADPFIIAKAKVFGSCIITQEANSPNSFKIPYICGLYKILCKDLTGYLSDCGFRY